MFSLCLFFFFHATPDSTKLQVSELGALKSKYVFPRLIISIGLGIINHSDVVCLDVLWRSLLYKVPKSLLNV